MLEEADHASFKSEEIPSMLFVPVDLLNTCESVSGSSPRISPLRGLTGYVRASKDAD